MNKTALIPQNVIQEDKHDTMALINFLNRKGSVAVPEFSNELVKVLISTPCGPILKNQERGYGYDCECQGTGWKYGQVMCGRHIPIKPLRYFVD